MSTTSVNSVYSGQYNVAERISRLEDDGFTVFQQDESIFLYDVISGRKYWSEVGIPIIFPYTGNHKKNIVYGAIAKSNQQFFRLYNKFNVEIFVKYLKEIHKRFGKIIVMVDRASQHTSKLVRKLLAECNEIKLIYLQKNLPISKWSRRVLASSKTKTSYFYYKIFSDMTDAISKYIQTVRFNLNINDYIYRKFQSIAMNF